MFFSIITTINTKKHRELKNNNDNDNTRGKKLLKHGLSNVEI